MQHVVYSVVQKLFLTLLACALLTVPAFAIMGDADFLELCETGSAQQIVDAIKSGANVNARDKRGTTPLMRILKVSLCRAGSIQIFPGKTPRCAIPPRSKNWKKRAGNDADLS